MEQPGDASAIGVGPFFTPDILSTHASNETINDMAYRYIYLFIYLFIDKFIYLFISIFIFLSIYYLSLFFSHLSFAL